MSVGAVNKETGERIPTAGMPAVDSVLSGTSTNPVQNRVVKAALDEKVDAVSGKGLSTNDYSNTDKAKVDASLNVFTGTQAAWAALSTAEKKTYQRADFTDDYDNTAIGDLTALHTSAKSSIVNAINEVADGKQNSTDNNLQTTAKTIVGGINEVKSGLTYHKVVESAATGTYSSKLQSLDSVYSGLSLEQKLSAVLVLNGADFYYPVNASGVFNTTFVASNTTLHICASLVGTFYSNTDGTIADQSATENASVFSIWVAN